MTCDYAWRLGVYALDVDDSDRPAVDQHVSSCSDCRAELAELTGLRGMLAMTRDTHLGAADQAVGPSANLLDRVLTTMDTERTEARSARRRRQGLAAAAAVLAVGSVAGVALTVLDDGPPAAVLIAAGESDFGVSAETAVQPELWGTRITMTLRGLPLGTSCRLVARAGDDRAETIASWHVSYQDNLKVEGMTSIFPDDLAALEVVDDDGRRLITTPLTPTEGTP